MSYSRCCTDHTYEEKSKGNNEAPHEVDITHHGMISLQEFIENQAKKLLCTDKDSINRHEAIKVTQQRVCVLSVEIP